MSASDTTSDTIRRAATAIRDTDAIPRAAVPHLADLLDEIARQYDAPPCDAPAGACSACEWREDFTDALRLARAYLGEAAP